MRPTIYLERTDPIVAERLESAGFSVKKLLRPQPDWFLVFRDERLQLCRGEERAFSLDRREVKRKIAGGRNSLLARACGVRQNLRILDAFGGWGSDGLALASLGCKVDIVERDPIVFTMTYFLARELHSETAVFLNDARSWILERAKQYDVIYIDPMFPSHPKSAKPSRRMQILEELSPYEDPSDLIEIARNVAKERVVVKSRSKQKPAREEPDWQIKGRTVRFDVYKT